MPDVFQELVEKDLVKLYNSVQQWVDNKRGNLTKWKLQAQKELQDNKDLLVKTAR